MRIMHEVRARPEPTIGRELWRTGGCKHEF